MPKPSCCKMWQWMHGQHNPRTSPKKLNWAEKLQKWSCCGNVLRMCSARVHDNVHVSFTRLQNYTIRATLRCITTHSHTKSRLPLQRSFAVWGHFRSEQVGISLHFSKFHINANSIPVTNYIFKTSFEI